MTVTMDSGEAATEQILLCPLDDVNAQYIQDRLDKPPMCFTDTKDTAKDFLDFTQVLRTQSPSSNSIEENEVAFNMRMDERILPVGPASDNSFVKVLTESKTWKQGSPVHGTLVQVTIEAE